MIQRIKLDLNFKGNKEAISIQDEIIERIKTNFPNIAQKIIDELNINEASNIVIDKLEINIGSLAAENAGQNFMTRLAHQFSEKLNAYVQHPQQEGLSIHNTVKSEEDAYFHFLENGYFPWWHKEEKSLSILAAEVQTKLNEVFFKRIFLVKNVTQVIERHFISIASTEKQAFVVSLYTFYLANTPKTHKGKAPSEQDISFLQVQEATIEDIQSASESLNLLLATIGDQLNDKKIQANNKERFLQYFKNLQYHSRQVLQQVRDFKLTDFPIDLLILISIAYNIEGKFPKYSLRLIAKIKQQHRLRTDSEIAHFLTHFIDSNSNESVSTYLQNVIKSEFDIDNKLTEANTSNKRTTLLHKVLSFLGFQYSGSNTQSIWSKVALFFGITSQEEYLQTQDESKNSAKGLNRPMGSDVGVIGLKDAATISHQNKNASEEETSQKQLSTEALLRKELKEKEERSKIDLSQQQFNDETSLNEGLNKSEGSSETELNQVKQQFGSKNSLNKELTESEENSEAELSLLLLQQLRSDASLSTDLAKEAITKSFTHFLQKGIWPVELSHVSWARIKKFIEQLSTHELHSLFQETKTHKQFAHSSPLHLSELIADKTSTINSDFAKSYVVISTQLRQLLSTETYSWVLGSLVATYYVNNTNWKQHINELIPKSLLPENTWQKFSFRIKAIFAKKDLATALEIIKSEQQLSKQTWLKDKLQVLFTHMAYYIEHGMLAWNSPFENVPAMEKFFWSEKRRAITLTATYLSNTLNRYQNIKRLYHFFSENTADAIYNAVFEKNKNDISDLIDKVFWKSKDLDVPDNFSDMLHRSIFVKHSQELRGALTDILEQNQNSKPKRIAEAIFGTLFQKYKNDIIGLIETELGNSSDIELSKQEIETIYSRVFHAQEESIVRLLVESLSENLSQLDYSERAKVIYQRVFEGRKVKFDQLVKQSGEDNLKAIHDKLQSTDTQEMYQKLIEEKFDWQEGKKEGEPIHVNNAGLVILWTFFPHLLKRLGLIKTEKGKNIFVDKQAHERAVIISQYLVVGNKKSEEHELVLNKLICGYTVSMPVNTNTQLTETEKEECDALLGSVIKHWSILGDISVDALRETFLQRKGMLLYEGENVNLKVEQKGVDVLIDKLPWAFSTIRFSWNDFIIFVEWNA